MTQISSITRGPRQSNMELLRIIAMLLVVVVHADFYSLGEPTKEDFYNSPVNFLTRTFFEAVSIICVNVFILISGWFGIKASCKGLMNFFFQCGYFLFGIYILMIVLGDTNFSLKGIAACLCLVNPNWFIIAYLGLYLLSPLINKWLEVASKKHIEKFLLCFFVFQAYVGWIGETVWINWGCSTFSFIGLYVLGKYLHISNTQGFKWGGVFWISVLGLTGAYLLKEVIFHHGPGIFAYTNPLVILESAALLMVFAGIKMQPNKFINWIASSSFAVYLLHQNIYIAHPYFIPYFRYIYENYYGVSCLAIMGVSILAIYLIAVLVDQPRKWLWKMGVNMSKRIYRVKEYNW